MASIAPQEAKSIGIDLGSGRIWNGPDCRRWVHGMAYDHLVRVIWSGHPADCIRLSKENAERVFAPILLEGRRAVLARIVTEIDARDL